jgi:hypothetical protein
MKKTKYIIIVSVILALTGCKGGGGGGATEIEDAMIGVATLSWIPPTTNTDDSSLDDLAGYKIYYGEEIGDYPVEIDIVNPGIVTYIVEGLPRGTYYFVVTAYDLSGNESGYSNIASKDIN